MMEMGLDVAAEKTEAVLLVSGKQTRCFSFGPEADEKRTKEHIKYLGVWIGANRSLAEHKHQAGAKCVKAFMSLSALMPKEAGPSLKTRRIIAQAAFAAALNTSPACAHVLKYSNHREALRSGTRPVLLMVCRGSQGMSTQAAEVNWSIPPTYLRAEMALAVARGVNNVLALLQRYSAMGPGTCSGNNAIPMSPSGLNGSSPTWMYGSADNTVRSADISASSSVVMVATGRTCSEPDWQRPPTASSAMNTTGWESGSDNPREHPELYAPIPRPLGNNRAVRACCSHQQRTGVGVFDLMT